MKKALSNFKQTFIVFAVLLTFFACKKQTTEENFENKFEQGFKVVHNVLVFKNQTSFDKVFNELTNKDKKYLDAFQASIGFVSYRSTHAVDTTAETVGILEKPFDPMDFPHISSLLNKDGIYVIGDKAFQYKNGEELVTKLKSTDDNEILMISKDIQKGKIASKANVDISSAAINNKNSNLPPTKSAVLGTYTFPENSCPGRPERSIYQAAVITSTSFIQCVIHMNGQAYRKGGLFGSKAWREDEMDFVAIDMSYGYQIFDSAYQYVTSVSNPFTGTMYPAYNVITHSLYSPNFYSILGPGEHFEGIWVSGHIQVQKRTCMSLIDTIL